MKLTRPRRLTLLLGVPTSLALIGWTSFNFVALAGTGTFTVNESFPLHNNTLNVHLAGGGVTLVPEAGTMAHLTGQVKYSLIKPTVNATANGIGFDCPVPAGFCSFTATMTVPPAAAVNLSSGAGDLTVNGGGTGELTLGTSAGNVTATGISASEVSVHSDAGDITLQFSKVPAHVSVRDSAGDITIEVPGTASYQVIANSNVGDSTVHVPQSSTSSHVIEATSDVGDVTVTTG
jgi:hypothetical protein